MNKKKFVSKNDIEVGIKRINIFLKINDYCDLMDFAESIGVQCPGTAAAILLTKSIKEEMFLLKKKGELPGQQNIFNAVKIKTKNKQI